MPLPPKQRLANSTPAQSREAANTYRGGKYDSEAAINKADEIPWERELRPARDDLLRYAMASSSSNVVGVHYRVGKKIGEGSFGVIFEGTNLLNNQQVAIKFVRITHNDNSWQMLTRPRNQGKVMRHNCAMNTEPTRFWWAVVSLSQRSLNAGLLTLFSWHT